MKPLAFICFFLLPCGAFPQKDSTGEKAPNSGIDTNAVDTARKPVPPLSFPSRFRDSLSLDAILRHSPLQSPTYPGLGNLGLDAYSILPVPSGTRGGIGFRIGLPPNRYAFPRTPPSAFDVRVPTTRLEYSMGSQEEQFFMITHTQNITPRWNVGLRYRKFGGPGFYRRQKTNFGQFLFSTNYRSADGRYQVMAAFRGDRSRLQQNGGIQDPTVFEENEESSRGAFRIRLDRARSRSKYDLVHIRHSFFPSGRDFQDSLSSRVRLGIFHRANAKRLSLYYKDDDPTDPFHDRILLDSSRTRDQANFRKLGNKGGFVLQQRKEGKVHGELKVAYHHRFLENRLMDRERSFQDGIAFFEGDLPLGDHRLEASGKYGVQGYGKGDMRFSGEWILDREVKDLADSIGLSLTYKDRNPAYLQEHYRSNHFRWNKDLPSIQSARIRIRFGEPMEREGFALSHTRMRNFIYYAPDAKPRSSEAALRFLRARARQRFRYKKWGFDLEAAWQREWNSALLRFPELYSKGDLFYETPLFQHALTARFGIRCEYWTAYEGYAYMPVNRRFFIQEGDRIGDYPFLDVYFHGRVGDILFFLELDHGNAGLSGYRYYGAPNYPLRDRMIRAGFKWTLYN